MRASRWHARRGPDLRLRSVRTNAGGGRGPCRTELWRHRNLRGAAEVLPFADHSFELIVTRYSRITGERVARPRRMRPGDQARRLLIVIDMVAPELPCSIRHCRSLNSCGCVACPRLPPVGVGALLVAAGLQHRADTWRSAWSSAAGSPHSHLGAARRGIAGGICRFARRGTRVFRRDAGPFVCRGYSLD